MALKLDIDSRLDADPDSEAARCRQMWAEVIVMCWNDAFGSSSSTSVTQVRNIREEARRWLTAAYGDFCKDRNEVAALAGFDGDWLRDKALVQLSSPEQKFADEKFEERLKMRLSSEKKMKEAQNIRQQRHSKKKKLQLKLKAIAKNPDNLDSDSLDAEISRLNTELSQLVS